VRRLGLAAALVAAWSLATAATWLQFESRPADGSPGMTVTGLLRLPEGEGPFPAAILLADCDGISPHERQWAQRFVEAGYAAYLLDSFFTRNVTTACAGGAEVPVMDDLLGAIARLGALPQVDITRLVVVGWQSGADVVLSWAATPGEGQAIAFYPSCAETAGQQRPIILVLPEAAPGVSACTALAANGSALVIEVPGVGAGFDCENCAGSYLGGPGGWDAEAGGRVRAELFDRIDFGAAP